MTLRFEPIVGRSAPPNPPCVDVSIRPLGLRTKAGQGSSLLSVSSTTPDMCGSAVVEFSGAQNYNKLLLSLLLGYYLLMLERSERPEFLTTWCVDRFTTIVVTHFDKYITFAVPNNR